ncbi:MAG: dienelactone hydrolase family protein [Vulcanimicrobiaceae bacterium]
MEPPRKPTATPPPVVPEKRLALPFVREDDPSIVVDRVSLKRLDCVIESYSAWPRRVNARTPAVVIAMDIWGVDASIRDLVRRFAKAGFITTAPDLFGRLGASAADGLNDPQPRLPYVKQLTRAQCDGDIRAAALWVTTRHPASRLAIVGLGIGGRMALQQAEDNDAIFVAAVSWYGPVSGIDPDRIHMPICGNYGAGDTSVPVEEVRLFRDALRVPHDLRIYRTAAHGFFDERRAAYAPAAANDAWPNTISFLRRYLVPSR